MAKMLLHPDDKHCNVLQAASLHCQSAGRSGAGTCLQEKPFPCKEKKTSSNLHSSISTGSSTP